MRRNNAINKMAEAFGNQPNQVNPSRHGTRTARGARSAPVSLQAAVTFSKERNLERQAVVDERELLRDALRRSMGEAQSEKSWRSEFENRVNAGEFIGVATRTSAPGSGIHHARNDRTTSSIPCKLMRGRTEST